MILWSHVVIGMIAVVTLLTIALLRTLPLIFREPPVPEYNGTNFQKKETNGEVYYED